MEAYLTMDEWWPVYTVSKPGEEKYQLEKNKIEISEELYERAIKVTEEFNSVQDELGKFDSWR